MIQSFSAQYAGYIDLERVGYLGRRVDERWYPNDRLIEVFENARAIAQLVERSGYHSFWTAEHHFQREGYECIPNVLGAGGQGFSRCRSRPDQSPLGLGHEGFNEDLMAWKSDYRISENNQRSFYRRWAQLMAATSRAEVKG